MKKRGISVTGIIVFIGLIALIAWGLNYIINDDYVTVRPSTLNIPNQTVPTAPTLTPIATSTPTSTSITTPAKAPTPTIPTPTQISTGLTITFDGKSFTPANLTVKKGQTVKFVNNSSNSMWVAANPFPTSSEYPAFNEKSGVASGSSWSFTFDKTGTWFYHNHYIPALGGKIVVNAQ